MKAVVLLSMMSLAACASGPAASVGAPGAEASGEAIYAVAAGKDGLKFRVSSNGCTTRANFAPDVRYVIVPREVAGRTESVRTVTQVALVRVRPDTCQSFAIGSAYVDFSYAELKIEPDAEIEIRNPLTPWRGPGD